MAVDFSLSSFAQAVADFDSRPLLSSTVLEVLAAESEESGLTEMNDSLTGFSFSYISTAAYSMYIRTYPSIVGN